MIKVRFGKIGQALLISHLALLIISTSCGATCGGGGGGGAGGLDTGKVYFVPWKLTLTPADMPKEGLVLNWVPLSMRQYQISDLRYSKLLSVYGARCVTMSVVDPNSEAAAKLLNGGNAPLMVLTEVDGTTIGKVKVRDNVIDVADVEDLVQNEVSKRDLSMNEKLDDARSKVKSGQTDEAISEFKEVLAQRCLFPKRAKEAQRELSKLGVPSAATIYDAPQFTGAASLKVQKLMDDGLKAELAADYPTAKRDYSAAHALDPSDPVPLRFLGEVYRHHLGKWEKARETFEAILRMPADPVSRAVALHGLGKMTIHEGEFKKGLALMEQSAQTYPLAMDYRNLAVYWNSEGDPEKANYYTQLAFKLSPNDPYNLVFATVFTAANGHPDQALKIAQDNEGLLPASYNLAAIYAQLGQKDKALKMLKRHFYEYERYEAVREKEMMEARVDFVFKSLVKDPDFLALTNLADGKLPMKMSDK